VTAHCFASHCFFTVSAMAVSFGKSVLCAQVLVLGTRAESNLTSHDEFDLCPGSSVGEHPPSEWAWSTAASPSPSCMTPRAENRGKMCNDDPTSVVIQNYGTPSCLVTDMSDCKLNLREVEQIDFDLRIRDCGNTWAAPLWLTPDRWSNEGGAYNSGELDLVELCVPNGNVQTNFAGPDGNMIWPIDPNYFIGHVTMWNRGGDITVAICNSEDPGSFDGSGSCNGAGSAYRPDIYNSNACKNGNCQYRMVSDIWNGNGGDSGFTYCSNRDNQGKPESEHIVGLPSTDSCSSSVRKMRVKGPQFSGKCAALSANQDVVV